MNKKTILWIGVGCVSGCAILGIIFLLLGGSFVKWVMQKPENITIDVLAPIKVSKGEDFVVEVQVTNTASEPQELNSIDFDLSYLDGINVNDTEPEYVDFSNIDFGGDVFGNYFSYYFEHDIPANSELTVKFYMTGLIVGDYSGSVDVCINTNTNCKENIVRTIVE